MTKFISFFANFFRKKVPNIYVELWVGYENKRPAAVENEMRRLAKKMNFELGVRQSDRFQGYSVRANVPKNWGTPVNVLELMLHQSILKVEDAE